MAYLSILAILKRSQIVSDILEKDIPESSWSNHEYLNEKALRDAEQGKDLSASCFRLQLSRSYFAPLR